jgi:hypothetical protein
MKVKYIYLALVLVTIPAIYYLNQANLTSFKWNYLFIFWPVLIIIWGIHLLPFRETYRLLIIIGTMVICGFFIYIQLMRSPEYFPKTYDGMMHNKYIVKFRENLPYREEIVDPSQLEKEERQADSASMQPQDTLPSE